jgi:flagellar protein FliO/FliZ
VLVVFAGGISLHAQESAAPASGAGEPVDESSLTLGDGPAAQDNPEITPLSTFGLWDFLRMVLVLALIVALIYGVFHFIRKAGGPRDDGVRFIRVLETRPLTGSRHLHLVEVGGEVFLVGSAENGVHLVSGIHDKETLDSIRLAASRARPRAASFAGALKGFFGKARETPPASGENPAESGEGSLEFMRKQKERLKKLF